MHLYGAEDTKDPNIKGVGDGGGVGLGEGSEGEGVPSAVD